MPSDDTLQQFHFFPQLPKEIRFEIWKDAHPGPRTVQIQWSRASRQGAGEKLHFISRTPIPGILQACQESRNEASRFFTRTFTSPLFPAYTWFDYSTDTLQLSNDDDAYLHNIVEDERIQLRRVVIESSEVSELQWCFIKYPDGMRIMRNLKELTVLSGAELRKWGTTLKTVHELFETWFAGIEGWVQPVIKIKEVETGDEMDCEESIKRARILLESLLPAGPVSPTIISFGEEDLNGSREQ